MKGSVTRGYLRLRILVALFTVLVVAVVSHQLGQASHRNVVAKASIVDAIDQSTTALVESQSNIIDIRNAREKSVAGAARTRIKKMLPLVDASLKTIRSAMSDQLVSQRSSDLLRDEFLDPIGQLEDFHFITKALVQDDTVFGARSERLTKAARGSVSQLLPLMAQLKTFEMEDLAKANFRLTSLGDLLLGTMVLILVLIALFVFRPMEKSVLNSQKEAQRKQSEAEAASESKSNFLAAMSHEIRTPMNGVLGMTELLMDTDLDSEQRRMVEIVNSSGRSLLSIIDDVLDFSKVEAGKLNLESRPFDLGKLLINVTELLRPAAAKSGVKLTVEKDPLLAACVIGDEGRLGQILTNLLGNAVKFSKDGAVALTVKVLQKTGTCQALQISVSDNGIGMTKEQLGRIFTKFEQADNSTTRQFGGTGLGLAISAGLAEAMGGRIWAESTFGKGSTFHVQVSFDVHEVAVQKDVVPLSTKIQADYSGVRVLVAEDNGVNQLVIRKMLTNMNCKVSIAVHGAEAVEKFKADKPDIVLMDISMPVMNGYDAAREIRADEHQTGCLPTPIIALSAHIDADHRQRCSDAGMNQVMAKPVSLEKLSQTFEFIGISSRKSHQPQTIERIAQ